MVSNRAYKRTGVNKIDREALRDRACEQGGSNTVVGLDIAKQEIVACLRWPDGSFERPWSAKNPVDIPELIGLLKLLSSVCDGLRVGLESTGSYSESVRRSMTEAGIEVHRVSGKSTSDYQEVFDGVPSQHDGKDAAIIAELTAFGKGAAWPFSEESELVQQIGHQMLRLDAFLKQRTQWLGRLEGLLGAHWPELTSLLKLNRVTILQMLSHYGSPAALRQDAQASVRLARWGGGKLTPTKIEQVIRSAATTCGVPMSASQRLWMQEVATESLDPLREVQRCQRKLKELTLSEATTQRYVDAVGASTLGAIWSSVGDPRRYDSSKAFLKALGLNLQERSSGRFQGTLSITKRGSSRARRWLYYWALRSIQREELRAWYETYSQAGQRSRLSSRLGNDGRKRKGLTAVMRKLSRGLWRACQLEEPFDYGKVLQEKPRGTAKAGRRRRRKPSCDLERK